MRPIVAAAVAMLAALVVGCAHDDAPSSMFDDAGYHVRGCAVTFLNPFPGKAFRIVSADPATFEPIDRTYARDHDRVYNDGHPLPGARAGTLELLDRPGLARDSARVYLRDRIISTDPDGFELLDGGLARDRTRVYRSDGSVLSDDPRHFTIVSDRAGYLYAKDGRAVYVNGAAIDGASPQGFRILDGAYSTDGVAVFSFDRQIPGADPRSFRTVGGPYAVDAQQVYWMGRVIDGADPTTFTVLNANFECSADRHRAYYRQTVIADADPAGFPPERPVTGCSEATISFGR
jgi:hypothetical protein